MILAPMAVTERDEHGEDAGEKRLLFRSAFVFADVQTDPLAGVEPAPLEPPSVAIDGDSHGLLLEPLACLAGEVGFSMSFAELDGERGGFCDYCAKRIVIEDRQAPNAKVRVAIHEYADLLVMPTRLRRSCSERFRASGCRHNQSASRKASSASVGW